MQRHLALIITTFKNSMVYRVNLLFYSLGTIFEILMMSALWKALYGEGLMINDLGLKDMITYSCIAFTLNILFSPWLVYDLIVEKIRKGDIALELLRPINFQIFVLTRYIGDAMFRFLFIYIPFLLFSKLLLDFYIPKDLSILVFFVLSSILGFLLNFSIWYIFCLVTFYTLDNEGILLTFLSTLNLFSGLVIPFWLFPQWLKNLAEVLPFKGIYYIPLTIYLQKATGAGILRELTFQICWLICLFIFGQLIWRLVMRKVVVQGG